MISYALCPEYFLLVPYSLCLNSLTLYLVPLIFYPCT